MREATPLPYCGAPPLPGGLAWNSDPLLVAVLLAGLALAWGPAGRAGGRRALLAGGCVLALALLSPLCGLAVALFSARVAQHIALLLAAAPLLAMALPSRGTPAGALAGAAGAFAAMLWLWHLPGPYALTFRSDLAWWAMHATLLGTAIWLWQGVLASHVRPDAALLAGLATAAQMGALGAFLTFAPRPLFAPHAATTLPWGLTPLEDQQLGGLIMWVPGGMLFAALALAGIARLLAAVQDRPAA
jgi:putative membrane protein